MVNPDGELIRSSGDFGIGRIGVLAIGPGRVIWQGIVCEYGNDRGIDRHSECVAREGERIDALPLSLGRYGNDLCRSQHLPEALILAEIEGAISAIVDMRKHDRPSVGKTKLVA